MSSEETTVQIEVVEKPKNELIIINDKQSQDGEIDVEKYQAWSDKSKDVLFKSSLK